MELFDAPLRELKEFNDAKNALDQGVKSIELTGCTESGKCHFIQAFGAPFDVRILITSDDLNSDPASSLFFTLMETLRIFFLVAASAGTACHPVRSAAVSSSRIALISFFICFPPWKYNNCGLPAGNAVLLFIL